MALPKSTDRKNHALSLVIFASVAIALSLISITGHTMELFMVRFVEFDGSRLIATSNLNYAIASPKLKSKNWRTISVNGDQLMATTSTGEKIPLTRAGLQPADMLFIETLRDEIANSNGGYMHTSTAIGSGVGAGSNFMVGGTSSMSDSSFSSSSSNMGSGADMSYNMRDTNNFSIARSDLPFNWSRIFFNDDLITLVLRNGEVYMLPVNLLDAVQLEAIEKLKREVDEMRRSQAQHFANTMENSMNMVSGVFKNIMGQFPRPPDYQSSVGNMFGNNFPFGPNRSPFDPAAGWPFANGGAGSAAFAGRR